METIKETKKALLIKEGEKTFWIQKRWMRADGTLTPAGEKARAEATTPAEDAAARAEEKNRKVAVRFEKIVKETDKAVYARVGVDTPAGQRGIAFWWPKSQIEMDGSIANIPAWLIQSKADEFVKQNPACNWLVIL